MLGKQLLVRGDDVTALFNQCTDIAVCRLDAAHHLDDDVHVRRQHFFKPGRDQIVLNRYRPLLFRIADQRLDHLDTSAQPVRQLLLLRADRFQDAAPHRPYAKQSYFYHTCTHVLHLFFSFQT